VYVCEYLRSLAESNPLTGVDQTDVLENMRVQMPGLTLDRMTYVGNLPEDGDAVAPLFRLQTETPISSNVLSQEEAFVLFCIFIRIAAVLRTADAKSEIILRFGRRLRTIVEDDLDTVSACFARDTRVDLLPVQFTIWTIECAITHLAERQVSCRQALR
jgi:hypothetical protein